MKKTIFFLFFVFASKDSFSSNNTLLNYSIESEGEEDNSENFIDPNDFHKSNIPSFNNIEKISDLIRSPNRSKINQSFSSLDSSSQKSESNHNYLDSNVDFQYILQSILIDHYIINKSYFDALIENNPEEFNMVFFNFVDQVKNENKYKRSLGNLFNYTIEYIQKNYNILKNKIQKLNILLKLLEKISLKKYYPSLEINISEIARIISALESEKNSPLSYETKSCFILLIDNYTNPKKDEFATELPSFTDEELQDNSVKEIKKSKYTFIKK